MNQGAQPDPESILDEVEDYE